MESFGIGGVAAITIICYVAAEVAKQTPLDNRWLPSVCGILGAALGPVGMLYIPEFPAADPLTALAVGIVSGLAATGLNQVGKQLYRND